MTHFTARRGAARLALLAGLGAGACAVNPATGSRQLMLISESQEIAMGRDYDQQVAASIGLYPDSGLQRYSAAVRRAPRGHLRAPQSALVVSRGRRPRGQRPRAP